jgi:hypothetical protein
MVLYEGRNPKLGGRTLSTMVLYEGLLDQKEDKVDWDLVKIFTANGLV